jgi:hypothetical protein
LFGTSRFSRWIFVHSARWLNRLEQHDELDDKLRHPRNEHDETDPIGDDHFDAPFRPPVHRLPRHCHLGEFKPPWYRSPSRPAVTRQRPLNGSVPTHATSANGFRGAAKSSALRPLHSHSSTIRRFFSSSRILILLLDRGRSTTELSAVDGLHGTDTLNVSSFR